MVEVEEIHVATVNVRNNHDYSPPRNWNDPYSEKPWDERKTRLVDTLLSTGPLDIAGFQEVLHSQLLDLTHFLGKTYSYVGVGRDDGKEAGEYSPIFYNNEKYELVDWTTVWLSSTPDVPGSKGWDAALPRIATFLSLRTRTKHRGPLIHAINTHYDHRGLVARARSSLLIRSQIHRWVGKVEKQENVSEPGVILLFGDFNSPPHEDGYRNITSLHPLPSNQPSYTFLDTFTHFSTRKYNDESSPVQTRPYGPVHTYTDFAPPGSRNATRIDFIMLGAGPVSRKLGEIDVGDANGVEGRGGWVATRYACLDNFVEGDVDGWTGRWSDHRAVRVTVSKGY
ncbi:hypothetical protein CI109_100903 [Kwoniella shandongensis]|uniref:Endonuclease/exonuclease/phosphatase domain-containing protein n=1 Tax=Kwoniella shandongensis TaxID=1734106 RepID=A0A5M6C4E1_9TREE|nr:uncharacterized protein CI109_001370 [Kwoniella shandongensis]KAA5529968.1 hypothetical protein CI109_001370 [Kwoniella shandongensis]